jgi:Ser/Thr protein kinase RdoA (MazF antagonist)
MPQTRNPLWRLDGPGPTLVLKRLPQYPAGVEPVVEFRVLSHLQACGVPVAVPVPTDHGALHAVVEGHLWAVMPFLPHQSARSELAAGAAEAATAVGAAIGLLDRALDSFPWRVGSFVDDPVTTISTTLPDLPVEATRLVDPFIDRLRDTCADLPAQLTHGDCNDGNVLVDRGRVTGFIDVDHLPTGPRVRDLAYYLASRLRTRLGHPDTAEFETAALSSVFGNYVSGYHEAYPLTEQERDAIVPLMVLVEVGGAHWALNGWEPSPTDYRRSLHSLIWMTRHFDSLADSAHRP